MSPCVTLHAGRALALLQVTHHRIEQARLAGNRLVRPPLVLRVGNARLDQDGKLVQPLVDRGLEAQIVQKIKRTARHLGAAQQGVVRATQCRTRDLEDVIGQRPHLGGQGFVSDLRESLGHGVSGLEGGSVKRRGAIQASPTVPAHRQPQGQQHQNGCCCRQQGGDFGISPLQREFG